MKEVTVRCPNCGREQATRNRCWFCSFGSYVLLFALVGCGDDFSLKDGGIIEEMKLPDAKAGEDSAAVDANEDGVAPDVAAPKDSGDVKDAKDVNDAGMCIPKYTADAASVPWCKDNTNTSLGACCPGSSCACEYQPTHYWWCC